MEATQCLCFTTEYRLIYQTIMFIKISNYKDLKLKYPIYKIFCIYIFFTYCDS